MALLPGADDLLVPKGTYVLVKRFTSKEETRRVVAAVYDPDRIDSERVGFENHLNYFHRKGKGMPETLAKGLAAFLNSTLVDLYFRQFSGHTQVNATDLRNLKYPTRSQLEALGLKIGNQFPTQDIIDQEVEEALKLADATGVPDPVQAKKKIDEALGILKDIGMPRAQKNERSALTLLSLLDLRPETPWAEAKAPLMEITPSALRKSDPVVLVWNDPLRERNWQQDGDREHHPRRRRVGVVKGCEGGSIIIHAAGRAGLPFYHPRPRRASVPGFRTKV